MKTMRIRASDVKLRPLDSPELIQLVAGWMAQKENTLWLDFADGKVALTPAWSRLEAAMRTRRSVLATVVGATERGVRLDVLGLFATLVTPVRPSQDLLEVRVTRLDADEGRIFVSDRLATTGQLPLV